MTPAARGNGNSAKCGHYTLVECSGLLSEWPSFSSCRDLHKELLLVQWRASIRDCFKLQVSPVL